MSLANKLFSAMVNPISEGRNDRRIEGYRSLETHLDANGVVHVSPALLLVAAVPLVCIAFAGHRFNLGLENTLLIGIVRSFVQLMILGFILHPIFVLGMDWSWLVFLYVLLMILITTKESMSRMRYTYQHHALMTFGSFFVSIVAVGAFAFLVIIRPDPRWNPQYVIPICGMLMGNCINGVSLTANNLSTQIMEGGRREIELYLSFGASGWESVRRLVKGAIGTGATPALNSMNVIGLVSIPGMMTGQILGGSPVTEAAHYQILITWLIATCTFCSIIINVIILYRVTFDGNHVLRTDRFIEVVKKKKNPCGGIKDNLLSLGVQIGKGFRCCRGLWGHHQDNVGDESQPLSNQTGVEYGTSNSISPNLVQIQTRRLISDGPSTTPFFRVSNLQFSVPGRSPINSSTSSISLSSTGDRSPDPQPQLQQRRILCTNLSASLDKGEIGIVTGPSGSGKSTFLRVVSGLTPMDHGNVTMSGLSLAGCCGRDGHGFGHNNDMVQWRTAVRYVTQYKVDIPGTPRDFILRIASFCSRGVEHDGGDICAPSGDEMLSRSRLYLEQWGMGYSHLSPRAEQHPYLDNEWKNLSGGESQRTLLAIVMASRPSILLLDEATSGLDTKTEKCVEESIVDYVKTNSAVVLWVTHSEDIAERLLR